MQTHASTQQLIITCDISSMAYLFTITQLQSVAAIIFYNKFALNWEMAQKNLAKLKSYNITVILCAAPAIARKLGADGIHIENDIPALQALKKTHSDFLIGYGAAQNKHTAMIAGEYGADYLFFGALGKDTQSQPHPRNLALCSWWSEVMQIPAILQCGNDLQYVATARQSQAEYISIDNLLLNSFDKNKTIGYILNL